MIRKLLKSSLLHSAGIYTVATVINSAIPFFMMPILTRYLNPIDYGIVAMSQVLVSIVTPFTGVNIQGAISRRFFHRENFDFPTYVANCLIILTCSSLISGILILCMHETLSMLSSFPSHWFWVILVISSGQFLLSVMLVIWQIQNKALKFGAFQISQTLVNVLMSIWFVVYLHKGWEGRLTAQVATILIFSLASILFLYREGLLKFTLRKPYIIDALKFGVPLIPHALGGAIMTAVDRFFITDMVGIAATGVYTVGYQIGMILGLVLESFNQAWAPWLFERLKQDRWETKIKIVKYTYLYNVLVILAAVFLGLVSPWFLNFFVGKDFSGASSFVIWIALGFAFNGMYMMVCNYIFYTGKTSYLAWVTFSSSIVNIFLNYYLIKLNGAIGAAQAMALTKLLFFILTWILANNAYNMPWRLKDKGDKLIETNNKEIT